MNESLARRGDRLVVPAAQWLPGDSSGEPLPASEPAPKGLLGKWTSTNAWGEPVNLELTRIGDNRYQAVSYFKAKPGEREAYPFTVSRHGSRWYLSAKVPARFGGHFTIAGFEITDKKELVVYNLDIERDQPFPRTKSLERRRLPDRRRRRGVLINNEMDQVFSYLDDPANSDVFVEAVRYQRLAKSK